MENEDFVTYPQALSLKKLGFREECYNYYDTSGILHDNNYISNKTFQHISSSDLCVTYNTHNIVGLTDAPTLYQAQIWLRKEKHLYVYADPSMFDSFVSCYFGVVCNVSDKSKIYAQKRYDTPEEALSAGITECLKLLEENS